METSQIHYTYILGDGTQIAFDSQLNLHRIALANAPPSPAPEWTRLGFHQCRVCPLQADDLSHCPAALNLLDAVNRSGHLSSFSEVDLQIEMDGKTTTTHTTMQRGLRSLIGLLLATSDCPHTRFLKPMARFHLPLASHEETTYRAVTMYLLAQYLLEKEGHPPDFELAGLKVLYENLQAVNLGLANRIRHVTKEDSPVNAIIILDTFAMAMPAAIEDSLDSLRYLFEGYFPPTQ